MESALIDPHALNLLLKNNSHVKIIDATYPPRPGQPSIGNAIPFDIDVIADQSATQPHTIPSPDDFANAIGNMGIRNDDTVVVYDQSGIAMAAARAWWMFRLFGHKDVRVLDGGLPLWAAMGFPLNFPNAPPIKPETYTSTFNPDLLAQRDFIIQNLNNPDMIVTDARPADRFSGDIPDLRPGIPSGHIPGSTNIPTMSLLNPSTGQLQRQNDRIEEILRNRPRHLIASCGSGVTACVIALAFYEAGDKNVAVYDGSWADWAQPGLGLPVEQGPGK